MSLFIITLSILSHTLSRYQEFTIQNIFRGHVRLIREIWVNLSNQSVISVLSVIIQNLLIFCSGNNKDTRGTAFVVYDDIFDAKNACEHLSGYNLLGRYLIVLYYQPDKNAKKRELERQQKEIDEYKAKIAFDQGDKEKSV